MPSGMRGRVTLPLATCERCRKITQEIETKCMRQTMLHARIRHSLHQHPHESPVTHPVKFTDWNNHVTTHRIPLEECPVLMVMPVYEYPGILRNLSPEQTNFGLLTVLKTSNADELYQNLLRRPRIKSVSVESGRIETWVFAQWLAKIGYSFAVACLGLQKIGHSPLVNIIRTQTIHFGHLIGGVNDLRLPSREYKVESRNASIFEIELSDMVNNDGKIFWATKIRLMPMLETPTYLVVVGERI